ncbi:MAG: pseudaminic acid synthase [Elusimicrobiota bacterium]|jgi:N-acetylneuraminate synthase|nr:pseudaminic acid synthase [Elusimicrobiota bacterium]
MKNNNPFIIAEMSGNHNHSLNRALAIARAASNAGVSALKLQTYTADTMTIDSSRSEFQIKDKTNLWTGQSLYALYQKAYTPWQWHKPIFDECKKLGLICFSTPFDKTAVDFLEDLNCPIYKIASFENADLPLLSYVAKTKKPVIMSCAMASVNEIKEAVNTLTKNGCRDITLLKCTSAYPANPKDSNLLTIPNMIKKFPKCKIGLSDHTLGIGVSIASIALGAQVIEKHFTLSRKDGGVDSAFSMEIQEMKQLVEESRRAYLALGKVNYGLSPQEKKSLIYKRSLYVVKDIKKGEKFTKDNIRSIRPSKGLAPKHYNKILGQTAKRNFKFGEPLRWR